MMRYISITLFILFSLCQFEAVAKNGFWGNKMIIHRLQIVGGFLHLSDPDWREIWVRKKLIPEYRLSYSRFSLTTRIFTLGDFFLGEDHGVGKVLFIDGAAIFRHYSTVDLVNSIDVYKTKDYALSLGVGPSHRHGSEQHFKYIPNQTTPDILNSYLRDTNEWGIIGEASLNVNYLKYAASSFAVSYRLYPNTTGMLTITAGFGLQIAHKTPRFLQ